MADSLDDGEFWLPSEFLTDDYNLMDKENINKNGLNIGLSSNRCFPAEFPCDFGYLGLFGSSPVFSSPVDSAVGSYETESDEEDLLTVLTRQLTRSTLRETHKVASGTENLEKSWVLSGSPQSTLSGFESWFGNGSPNGPSQMSSPPTTPLGANDGWDLIYRAAGQVARPKMNSDGSTKGRGLLSPPRTRTPVNYLAPAKPPNNGFYNSQCLSPTLSQTNHQVNHDQMMKQQGCAVWSRQVKEDWYSGNRISQDRGPRVGIGGGFVECGKPLGLAQSAWPPLLAQHQNQQLLNSGKGMRSVSLGGSCGGVQKRCTGTGVFLPRRYGDPSETHKKPGCSSALLPARYGQALNKNLEDLTVLAQPRAQPRFNDTFIPEYDFLMAARRTAFVAQQRRGMWPGVLTNHEIRLPQEWTY
ncbi:unnamed protein product [Ilex paraguariensis]|uniref:Uncharacterized protein n=1 Tax=Ilex paraguariensis TaxID=185542 RepID=A0ABC8TQQ4_9AQUA